MNTANKITVLRIAMIPFFLYFLYDGSSQSRFIALCIFVLASLTDFLDGYIARKYDQITDFGKFIDPLADKLLVCAAIIMFVQDGQMSAVFAFIVLAREFVITSLRTVAMGRGKVMAAAWSGKVKTTVQIAGVVVMLSDFAFYNIFGSIQINDVAVLSITLVTLYSGYDYMKANWSIIADGMI